MGNAEETQGAAGVTARMLAAEALGTAFLLAGVVGSGIMAETLAGEDVAMALLANTIATGALLTVLILMLAPLSGAHFNPAVTLWAVLSRRLSAAAGLAYVAVQIAGGIGGVVMAHLMFEQPPVQIATVERSGFGRILAEGVAAFGLVGTIIAVSRHAPEAVAYAVGLFITAGYWFTASTSFANPAVTLARIFTDTFTGIAPAYAGGFILAQLLGAVAATALFAWLLKARR